MNEEGTEKKEENLSVLEESRKLIEELKKQNEIKKELLEREERLYSENLLSGKSQAGQQPKLKTQEEKDDEEIKPYLDAIGYRK